MAWLEITVNTAADTVDTVAAQLTARGFSDLVIEDQTEFETFLEENRAYWDYIDEDFQQKLEGLSRVKLYLEDTDEAGLARLKDTVSAAVFTVISNHAISHVSPFDSSLYSTAKAGKTQHKKS